MSRGVFNRDYNKGREQEEDTWKIWAVRYLKIFLCRKETFISVETEKNKKIGTNDGRL